MPLEKFPVVSTQPKPATTAPPTAPAMPTVDPYPWKPFEPQRPPKPNPSDPNWRAEAQHEAVKVVTVTAALAAVARYAPHPYIRYPALFLAGLVASGQSKVKPSPNMGLNAAPTPVGYAEPKVYGLSKAWWLPPGSTAYVPREVDRLGLGLAEQREADEAAKRFANLVRARDALAGESNDVLEQLAGDPLALPTFSRANIIAATSETDRESLRLVALARLGRLELPPVQVTAGPDGRPGARLPGGFVELTPVTPGGFSPDAQVVTVATSKDAAAKRDQVAREGHLETRDP